MMACEDDLMNCDQNLLIIKNYSEVPKHSTLNIGDIFHFYWYILLYIGTMHTTTCPAVAKLAHPMPPCPHAPMPPSHMPHAHPTLSTLAAEEPAMSECDGVMVHGGGRNEEKLLAMKNPWK